MTVPDQREEQSFDTTSAEQEATLVEQELSVDSSASVPTEFSSNPFGEDNKRIGRALSDARVAKGWSIEEVSQLLKVRGQMVKDLEEGSIDAKSWIYVQGFYKAYSDILGVDRTSLPELQQPSGIKGVERYSALSGKPVFCQELSDDRIPMASEPSRILYPLVVAIIAAVVVAAGYFVVIKSGINFLHIEQTVVSKVSGYAGYKGIINTFPGTDPAHTPAPAVEIPQASPEVVTEPTDSLPQSDVTVPSTNGN